MSLSKAELHQTVYEFFKANKRELPWRETDDPYAILVSEVMLQQTQVPRVTLKFLSWMQAFPTVETLAEASLGEVLQLWSGLGYNRRGKYLHETAQKIVNEYGGAVPREEEALRSLPGIGAYTAAAIQVFAFRIPAVMIETNIRAVYIHHYFADAKEVDDKVLLPLIEETMDRDNPREWFSALMDYGSMLKSKGANPARKSKQYQKQSPFEGSKRQVRGAVLQVLTKEGSLCRDMLTDQLNFEAERIRAAIDELIEEGLITAKDGALSLPE